MTKVKQTRAGEENLLGRIAPAYNAQTRSMTLMELKYINDT
jgi:hypothetical protein